MKRPWVWVALSMIAGLYAARMGWAPGIVFPCCLLGVAILPVLLGKNFRYREHAVCAVTFFACGVLCWNVQQTGPAGDTLSQYSLAHPETEFALEGVVREASLIMPGADRQRFVLSVDHVQTKKERLALSGGVLVTWDQPGAPVHMQERLRVHGTLSHWLGPVNHGASGIEEYYRLRGVCSRLFARSVALERLGAARWSPYYWASRLRVWEAGVFRRSAPESVLPLLYTVWLGDSGQISGEPYNDYVYSGTAHILSVSGVHVSIVYVSVGFVLSIFIRNRRVRAAIMIGVLFLFALTAGARVACLRAAFMVALYLAADLVDREPDTPTALSLSAVILLILNPSNLFDAGFILSFGSVASILMFMEPLSAALTWMPRLLRANVAMTCSAQLLTIPLVTYYFHVFAPIGFLANLLVIPLLTGVLWLCFFTVLTAAMLPPAAVLFGHAIHPLANLTQYFAGIAAHLPYGHFSLPSPSPQAALLYWAAAAAFFMALGKGTHRKRWAAATAAVLLASGLVWSPWRLPASVDFLDVGHSDAAYVCTPAGTTLLIDGGDKTSYSEMGSKAVLPFLYGNGVTHLDYVIVTHAERDHIGGLLTVLRAMPVGAAIMGPLRSDKALEKEFLEVCAERDIPVLRVAAGDTLPVEGATIEVLHPPRDWPFPRNGNLNEIALTLRISWPGVNLLFTGDIDRKAEAAVAQHECRATVLKVPHHGSDTSSSPEFLDAVNPAYAVISTGVTGQWDAAAPVVLKRYEKRGISLLRTDYWGGIRLREENGRWVFSGARPTRGYSLEPTPNAK